MKVNQESIDRMAADIMSGRISVNLNASLDGGYIHHIRNDEWARMTYRDAETASALINEITNGLRPKLGYGGGFNPEQTVIFRI